jgi:hypothetical protein
MTRERAALRVGTRLRPLSSTCKRDPTLDIDVQDSGGPLTARM